MVNARITALRELMERDGIHAFIVTSDDFHGSEYTGEYFKTREFITGFTGSAGTAVIFREQPSSGILSGLWTDGRYFIQARKQLEDSELKLFAMGEKDVPAIEDYLSYVLDEGACIGFDGRTVSIGLFEKMQKTFNYRDKNFAIKSKDLVGEVWENDERKRPELSCEKAYLYDEKYAGKSRAEKLAELKASLSEQKADLFVLSSLDDIAWLLNIRGNDVLCNPVVLSYFVMHEGIPYLFIQQEAAAEVKEALENDGVIIKSYDEIYAFVAEKSSAAKGVTVVADKANISYEMFNAINPNAKFINKNNWQLIPKAVKNGVEADNMRLAHLRDGVAVTKWIYWLKRNAGKVYIDELTAAAKLAEFRRVQENNRGDSFAPIIAYKEHAALPHYSASKETCYEIKAEGLVLADTGGQYLEGTTDITRTIKLGEAPLEDSQKKDYTVVLKGHLALQNTDFEQGTTGGALDRYARGPVIEIGKDYNHGTGHGVGCFLNVHESPVRISKPGNLGKNDIVFEPGMVTSNEPAIYEEGSHGIRIENLLLCVVCGEANAAGNFEKLCFEPLTLVPYEREAIDFSLLCREEKIYYNEYHRTVREKLMPYLTEEEAVWLSEVTAEV